MHAPLLGDTALANADWLNRETPMNQALIGQLYAGFVERYRDRIAAEHRDVCERLLANPVIESYEVTISELEPTS